MRGLQVRLGSPPFPAHHGCQLWRTYARGGGALRICLTVFQHLRQASCACLTCARWALATDILKQGLMLLGGSCLCLRGICQVPEPSVD